MTSERTHELTRRGLLGATFAAGVMLAAEASPVEAWAAAGDVTISASGVSVLASVGGRVAIRDGQGTTRSAGSKFQIKDTAAGIQLSTGGTPTLTTLADGTPAIRMDYTMPLSTVAVYGLFTVSTNRVHLEWHVTGPATLVPDGFLFSRAIQSPTEADAYVPVTEWVRDSGGGIPYEDTVGIAHTSTWGSLHGMFLLADSRQAWTNATWIHAPGVPQTDGSIVSQADFFFTTQRPKAAASIGTAEDLGIEVWTDQPFNLWGAAGATASVHVQVANGSQTTRAVDLDWWVKDFNGTQLTSGNIIGSVPAAGTWNHTFTVAAPAAGIATAEVIASYGGQEAFARTNIGVLAPHAYQSGSDSMFGMANYPWLQVPSADALLDLWQLAGVNRVRIAYDGGPGLPPAAFDARGMAHNIELQPDLTVSDEAAETWAQVNTDIAISAGAECFEVGNELNRPFNEGTAAQAYIDKALRPVREYLDTTGADLKILNNGLAGMDEPWVVNFIAGGGWDLIDGFAYHPGRGNFTPDYVPDGGDWDAGATGTYWNFLGGLRKLQALMAVHGEKEIWLTEAYACTRPNGWWNDTYRSAAENVFLTLALAKAEGIRNVCWYQFHDSVLGKPQVADPDNVEYHFGLVNRDTSPKPSLLAYATAARELDQAVPLGWLAFPNPQTKGLLFDTPAGQAAVLWNRADGYLLNADHDPSGRYFPAPEPWVDHWPTKTSLCVDAAGAAVTQVDCIGQRRTIQAANGCATVVLDGAPRLFIGTDLADRLA
ncbi:hypothetical protein [Glycomyces dulcitolivorans]|uniref:hypothetical protein n=1 Tax=Glycomyces dulcitolivorans TaxID=2200759 RepID=UPI000DD453D4|nr:hypothetical protein [Glycomyces dulcitolivorans]